MKMIPHSRPTLGSSEAEMVLQVVQSGQIAQGSSVEQLEKTFSETFGLGQAVAVSSGTAGLHLALLAMKVGPGDEVIIPSFVCTALLNAVHYVGANPVLADVDPETFNIDPRDVEKRITGRTRAIIVPHLFGLTADVERLMALGVPLVEDCAQAIGGKHKDRPLGTFGHIAVFSFYATKVMTTGEGGLVASHDMKMIEQIKDLRNYDNRSDYRVRYNYKLSDIQAALGLTQLQRLGAFIRRRQEIADRYAEALRPFEIILPRESAGRIYFRYVVRVPDDAGRWIDNLAGRGITCARPVYKPLHHYLGLTGYKRSDAAWRSALSIPIYPSLTDDEVGRVIDALIDFMEKEQ